MLRSCPYCGRIHRRDYDCGKRPKRVKVIDDMVSFRSSAEWRRKREEIRARDNNLCQLCLREYPGTIRRLNYDNLSVHHALPLDVDFERRLDNYNLITTCEYHHKAMERGKIPLQEVLAIIGEQEERRASR